MEREQRGSVCPQSPQRTTGRGPQQLWSFLNKVTTAVELFNKVDTAVDLLKKINAAVEIFGQSEYGCGAFENKLT